MSGRRLWATVHAVERFKERIAPGFSYNHARRELVLLAANATPTKERTAGGQEIWLAGDGSGIRFVVKRDRAFPLPTIVTVLGPEEDTTVDVDAEIAEALGRTA